MKTFCSFHPTRPARWNCPGCRTNYCAACIDKREVEQYSALTTYYFCPKCNVEVKKVAFKNLVVPFWNRLPKFFAYPFQAQPLILMIILSIATPVLPKISPFFGWLILLALWGVFLKYTFIILKDTACGRLTPPDIKTETILGDFSIFYKQLGVFLIIGIAYAKVVQAVGVLAGLLFLALSVLYLPAIFIVLAVDNSFLNAVNPNTFVRIVWKIGKGYLLMYFFLLKIKQSTPEMLAHGKSYLDLLAKEDRKEKLCEVYLECASKDAEFTPTPATFLKISRCFNDAGNPRKALQVCNRVIKANLKNPSLPKAYYHASHIINEKFKNPKKAAAILKAMIKKYPEHEIIPQANKYLAKINMANRGQ